MSTTFPERLREALITTFGEQSEAAWTSALQRRGYKITQQGLNKWLTGKSLPHQHRWDDLARVLLQPVHWLRDGVSRATTAREDGPPYLPLRPDQLAILQLWESLDPNGRRAIEAVGHALAERISSAPESTAKKAR